MSTTITGIRIVDMPDLGTVTDDSSFVGEHAGSGRFGATALRSYMQSALAPANAVAAATYANVGRNHIHNSMMSVAQRGVGAFSVPGYTLDRWQLLLNTDTSSVAQQAQNDASRAQIGDEASAYYLGCSVVGSPAAAALTVVYQPIEDVRRLAGKTVTVSFWAVASPALKIGVSFNQFFGTGGAPSASVALSGQSVTLATTWARYSFVVSLPSIAGKTVGTDPNSSSTDILFWYSGGANSNLASGSVGAQNGTINIWGVQLEVGSTASPLAKIGQQAELAQCNRYYQRNVVCNMATQASAAGQSFGVGVQLPVAMRATPTLTLINNSNVNLGAPTLFNTSPLTVAANAQSVAAGAVVLSVNIAATADL